MRVGPDCLCFWTVKIKIHSCESRIRRLTLANIDIEDLVLRGYSCAFDIESEFIDFIPPYKFLIRLQSMSSAQKYCFSVGTPQNFGLNLVQNFLTVV